MWWCMFHIITKMAPLEGPLALQLQQNPAKINTGRSDRPRPIHYDEIQPVQRKLKEAGSKMFSTFSFPSTSHLGIFVNPGTREEGDCLRR